VDDVDDVDYVGATGMDKYTKDHRKTDDFTNNQEGGARHFNNNDNKITKIEPKGDNSLPTCSEDRPQRPDRPDSNREQGDN
jgi:hypothetical protein